MSSWSNGALRSELRRGSFVDLFNRVSRVDTGELVLVALAGFAAALVNGALGMGFGPTSSSILLSTGISPAGVSTTVNLAKVVIGVAAAISHWRFRNIDHRLVLQLAIPGCLGALIGVTVLANVDGDAIEPILAAMLILVGLRIVWRFRRPVAISPAEADDFAHDPDRMPDYDQRGVKVAATAGGVTNGLIGAWGPIVTPFLLHRGLTPRFAIGSVNTAEVAVARSPPARSSRLSAARASRSASSSRCSPEACWRPRWPRGSCVTCRHSRSASPSERSCCSPMRRVLAEWADLGSFRWLVYAGAVALVAAASLAPRLANGSTDDA